MPAKEKYSTDDIINQISTSRGLLTNVADKLGCSVKTIRRRAEKNKKIRNALELAREKMGDMAEGKLFLAIIDGEKWAIQLYLKTQCRNRGYFEKQILEHTGDPSITIKGKAPDFSSWELKDIEKYNSHINDAIAFSEKYEDEK